MPRKKIKTTPPQISTPSVSIVRRVFIFIGVASGVCLLTLFIYKTPSFDIPRISIFQAAPKEIPTSSNADVSYVDPYDVFNALKKKKAAHLLIVDMRVASEYEKKHIRGTMNIPFNQVSAVDFVKKVRHKGKDKRIVLIPYSIFSTSGEQALSKLEKEGVEAHLLTVGWNELYNLPNLWIPEEEWRTFNFLDMIEHAQ